MDLKADEVRGLIHVLQNSDRQLCLEVVSDGLSKNRVRHGLRESGSNPGAICGCSYQFR